MIPNGAQVGPPVPIVAGDAFGLPIQCYLRPSGTVPAQFGASDTLSASVYQAGVATAVFQPSVVWNTISVTGQVQTGYDQGQVLVDGTTTQGALFQPGIPYVLAVTWTPASDSSNSQTIAYIPITVGRPY